ncbi:hypothetical protein [Mycoplasma phocimorsus]|uniref:hypothetical protein n=1 Tax=Mycoplasma phocimorsus TaxID=3045839 RepID=UPI0024C07884|nr:hypothetical protein [Mycoplasma phocimorsus]
MNSGKSSLSRIGSSLDDCEIEYWFSILKSKYLNRINISKLILKELKKVIKIFVK